MGLTTNLYRVIIQLLSTMDIPVGNGCFTKSTHIKVVGFGVSGSWHFLFATHFFCKKCVVEVGNHFPQISVRTFWENHSKPPPTRWFSVSFWSTGGGHLTFWKGHESPSSKRSPAEWPGIRYTNVYDIIVSLYKRSCLGCETLAVMQHSWIRTMEWPTKCLCNLSHPKNKSAQWNRHFLAWKNEKQLWRKLQNLVTGVTCEIGFRVALFGECFV